MNSHAGSVVVYPTSLYLSATLNHKWCKNFPYRISSRLCFKNLRPPRPG